jgi:glycosyltransferase involved in cell wall biosynthesis
MRTPDSEILVVDNNSRDRTPEVVEEFCRRHPERVRYLFEPQPGKSHALNTGIRAARGEVLAFVDDDVTVEPGWLEKLTRPLLSGEHAGAGGRIFPDTAFSPPAWLPLSGPHSLGGALALFDCGDDAMDLIYPPYGTNMAFRKEVFVKYGDFRTDLGPRPGSEIRNEDTEFGRRLMTAGERLRYEPSAVVYHAMPTHRLQKSYFLRWFFDFGKATAREWPAGGPVFGLPRRYVRTMRVITVEVPVWSFRWLVALNPKRRFHAKTWVWVSFGQIAELLGSRRHGGGPPQRARAGSAAQ